MLEDRSVLGRRSPAERKPFRERLRPFAKFVIAGVTLLGLVDQGAQFIAAPLLLPALWWAARSSERWGATGFTLLAALLMAEVGWLLAYGTTQEAQPWILVWPSVAFTLTIVFFLATHRRAQKTEESP